MVEQTGLPGMKFKQRVFVAVDYLQEAGLIMDISPNKTFTNSKQIKRLTQLGKEVAELIDSIEAYYKSFSKLTNGIKRNFSILQHKTTRKADKKTIKIIMRNKGLTDKVKSYKIKYKDGKLVRTGEEYYDPEEYYHKLSLEANKLRAWTSPARLFNTIVTRYVTIISRFGLLEEKSLKKIILDGIITHTFSSHLSFFLEQIKDHGFLDAEDTDNKTIAANSVFNSFNEQTLKEMVETILSENLLSNAFVEDEASSVLSSIVSMSKPSTEFIDYHIRELQDPIIVSEKLNHRRVEGDEDGYPKQYKKILALYEKQRIKSKK
jgi:hypothetical protein